MDNLLAQGKVTPMIVVIPETFSAIPDTETSGFTSVDEELFTDIIPFLNDHHNVRKDAKYHAIAGLSLGGAQTLYPRRITLTIFQRRDCGVRPLMCRCRE
jgi:enterochelin esterase-like enzyme